MNFFDQLQSSTATEREYVLNVPLIQQGIEGKASLETYVAFLCQAYHHVKHTTPLLMSAGARIPGHQEWLRDAIATYIEEELGHQEWILNDIDACGYDREAVRHSQPNLATELMVGLCLRHDSAHQPARFIRHGAGARRHEHHESQRRGRWPAEHIEVT